MHSALSGGRDHGQLGRAPRWPAPARHQTSAGQSLSGEVANFKWSRSAVFGAEEIAPKSRPGTLPSASLCCPMLRLRKSIVVKLGALRVRQGERRKRVVHDIG